MNSVLFPAAWMPEAASTHAEPIDTPLGLMLLAALGVLVVFVGLAIVFAAQYRREGTYEFGAISLRSSLLLRGLWAAGALCLGLLAAGAGFHVFIDRAEAPFAAETIVVTAHQGDWDFAYGNGHVADTLHVAAGRPVRLLLGSADVMHTLAIPAFRLNRGIVPGRLTETWFEATRPGTYDLQSNLYSGEGFTGLRRAVVVHDAAGYDAWLAAVSDIFVGRTPQEVGELLYNTQGCVTCHTTTGAKLVGPSFKNVYGYEFETADGKTITADDAYIRESILTPNVSVIAGYQPVMTPYAGILGDREIEAITAWLKTQSDRGGTAEADAGTPETETSGEGN